MGRGEKERKTMIFLRNWWKTEKNDGQDRSGGSKRLQKASIPAGNPEEGHLPPSQGGSACSERGKTFQKVWKTMIFLRNWWKTKKNDDPDRSEGSRRLQKASRPAGRVGDWGPPPSQGGSDCSEPLKSDENDDILMIFWLAKCHPPIALVEIWWYFDDILMVRRWISGSRISRCHENHEIHRFWRWKSHI